MGVFSLSPEFYQDKNRLMAFLTGAGKWLRRVMPSTGRIGGSFYAWGREIFIGIEVSKIIIPPKKMPKILKKGSVTFVPVD